MNDQLASQLRQYLQIIGTSLTTLGFVSANKADMWVTLIMSIFGVGSMIVSLYLSYRANTKESIIASATNMPEVDSKKLAAAISDPALKSVANNPTPVVANEAKK